MIAGARRAAATKQDKKLPTTRASAPWPESFPHPGIDVVRSRTIGDVLGAAMQR